MAGGEAEDGGGDRKRRMKSKEQLDALEKAYAEDRYPLEAMRAELSAALNLTDNQLKMWFSHRRLKDRKCQEDDNPSAPKKAKKEKAPAAQPVLEEPPALALAPPQPPEAAPAVAAAAVATGTLGAPAVVADEAKQQQQAKHKQQPQQDGMEAFDWEQEGGPKPRRKNPEGSAAARRRPTAKNKRAAAEVIAAIEQQLGEPVREDGPPLGVEFDPIPPAGFGAASPERDPSVPPSEVPEDTSKVPVRRGLIARKVKAAARSRPPLPTSTVVKRKAAVKAASTSNAQPQQRAVREYQFIPEQPTGRPEEPQFYDRTTQLNLYPNAERPYDVVAASRVRSLTQPGPLFTANEPYAAGDVYLQARVPGVGPSMFPPPEAGPSGLIAPNDLNFEGGQRLEGFTSFDLEGHHSHAPHALLQALATTKAFEPENLNLFQEQERARNEKKRKMELKEKEAQEKRLKKEMEKLKKKEEQLKKEQVNKAKKEQEKFQREQERLKREEERKEKKMEKLRQREELRQKKEAAKVKAANERATAKKLAKESSDLMDDERLELMEVAVCVQGLSSITQLPAETLEALDSFKAMLKPFPPHSLRMKRPFSVRPWTDHKENVGNAFMAWRFLTSFADVLGLWPFTFDELIQAFHDYDPRLLGEVHIALLKTLVKDVEEAAQAAATGVVGSQNALSIIAGGHPEIVEAAYAWGFDIREWKTHVSPLTWPEILRQFALAANFGPKWKKRKVEPARPREESKVVEGEDVVSTLRSGAAAANAVALMQGKGVGHVRRNQYRMTPGTVKFAAFHILSLEGDKGLSILQVADRIQKSGLRDLSSSRTPEASIAAALSRDANLFERVAPSTYCVRPAFRKDPVDAEEVLEAAREKISLFQSGMLEGEEADKEVEDVDEEVDRDEEYDMEEQYLDDNKSDYAETAQTPGKASFPAKSEKAPGTGDDDKKKRKVIVTGLLANLHCSDSGDSLSAETDNGEKEFQSPERQTLERLENLKQEGEVKDEVVQPESNKVGVVYEETEIDESQVGEPWVQGLTEGEYADLSVEERLSALVALVNVVNEGTTIRVALEERLEAAAALKRQMWAEAQLDRRRQKEEQLSRLQVSGKLDGVSPNGVGDGRQSPVLGSDCKQLDMSLPLTFGTEGGGGVSFGHIAVASTLMASQRSSAVQDIISGQDISLSSFAHSSEKSRAQLKADIGVRAEELYVLRSLPLGFDRRRNRYWQFVTSNGGDDPGCGRIYFESHDESRWEVVDAEEGLDALIASLDPRGIRENNLLLNLQRLECTLRLAIRNRKSGSEVKLLKDRVKVETTMNWLHEADAAAREVTVETGAEGSPASGLSGQETEYPDRSAAIMIDLGKTELERDRALERYRELDRWMWNEQTQETSSLRAFKIRKKRDQDLLSSCSICHDFYWPRDKHCPCCHGTFDSCSKVHPKFSEHTRECDEQMRNGDPSWKLSGPCSSQPSRFQLLKAETLAIEVTIPSVALKVSWKDQQRKAWVTSLKEASNPGEMLQVVTELESIVHRDWLSSSYETTEEMLKNVLSDSSSHQSTEVDECTRVLPWIPQTTQAVALRIAVLDAAIAYTHEEKLVREKLKEEEAKNVKVGVSAVKISPDLLAAEQNGANGAEECLGDGTGDAKGRGARKKRGDGQPRRTKARTSGGGAGGMGGGGAREGGGGSGNGKAAGAAKSTAGAARTAGGTGKRGLKRKLQFPEDGTALAGTATDTQQPPSKERKQRPRTGTGKPGGRPRGRPPGRPRNKATGGGSRGGRRGKAVPGGKKKERDPNELMVSAEGRAQKLSQERAHHDEDESDEEEDGYQHMDEQGDWGVPEESDEGEQFDEEQAEEDDNGEDMAEEEEEDDIEEDGSRGSGRAHHLVDQEDEDDVADEDDVRYEEEDGYRDQGEESEAEEEAEDEERVEEEVDVSDEEAGEQLPSYSSESD